MSDYTPTTAEVRNGFANNQFLKSGRDVAYLMEFAGAHQAEFDRWLAQHDAEVKTEAWSTGWRQRGDMTLDLLGRYKEDLFGEANSASENGDDPAWDIERAEAVERCIALIKGEYE